MDINSYSVVFIFHLCTCNVMASLIQQFAGQIRGSCVWTKLNAQIYFKYERKKIKVDVLDPCWMVMHYTVVQTNQTPTVFSNNFNKYWSISIILIQRMYKVSNVHICRLSILIKKYQLRLIPQQRIYTGPLHYCNKIF